ncbi:MAG: IS110 family transposase [Oscillospiraceae bacterium]|nr:IS110 family transposase [Oscillospiraceae bacterium]
MEYNPITAVGIDVSKGKSTVAVRRPGGEVVLTPFQMNHDASGLSSLIKTLRGVGGEIRVVMEHTGMYWRPIALTTEKGRLFCQRGQCYAHP